MPSGLFGNKASVNVYIFLFKVNRPHEEDDIVTFIDFSEDGYSRQNRKKSTQEVNLKNTDHAEERYAEVLALTTGKMPKTHYYTEENGKVIKDVISLNGDDWLFSQHQVIDLIPSKEEIKEKLKIFITRYQAKEAKEQIQYYRKGKISEEERNILKEMGIRIDQLDFDEAEILMKRWEGME